MSLQSIVDAIAVDPGLLASIPQSQIDLGLAASRSLNDVLQQMVVLSAVNADGLISEADMQAISDTIWLPANAQAWREFWLAHGNDSGGATSGYHWVQNDGGTLEFRGRNFINTVADGIYHFGFQVLDGRYLNEDGNNNESLIDVAGWLNYFVNGRSVIWGTDGAEGLGSGTYSDIFASARNETFYAGAGSDTVWADIGNDVVHGGGGHDKAGGGDGNDVLFGDAGNDTLWGDAGDDALVGGSGNDVLSAGDGNDALQGQAGDDVMGGALGRDTLAGGEGNDTLYGDAGSDRLSGEAGRDVVHGGDGGDFLNGGGGADTISGGEGTDVITGGTGADRITLWESVAAADRLVFSPGDSGLTSATIDRIEGFKPGEDVIDLRAFGAMTLEELDYAGGGNASCYYDGRHLRIDANGDRATDMIIQFMWIDSLSASDFLFGTA